MKKDIFNKRIRKKILHIIGLINIIVIILYKIVSSILTKWDLLFRGWVDIIYMCNLCCIIIISIVSINVFLCLKLYSTIKKPIKTISFNSLIVSIVIFVLITGGILGCLGVPVMIALDYAPEHIVYEQNKKVIAKVELGLLHTSIEFYEPVNIFLMRESNISGRTYKGGYDIYEKGE